MLTFFIYAVDKPKKFFKVVKKVTSDVGCKKVASNVGCEKVIIDVSCKKL
jgi:hypothetical protein